MSYHTYWNHAFYNGEPICHKRVIQPKTSRIGTILKISVGLFSRALVDWDNGGASWETFISLREA